MYILLQIFLNMVCTYKNINQHSPLDSVNCIIMENLYYLHILSDGPDVSICIFANTDPYF